jgi:hypothetical protein
VTVTSGGFYAPGMVSPNGWRLAGASVIALVLLTGCGGGSKGEPASDKDEAPTVSQSDEPQPPSDEAIKPYVEAIASEDLTRIRDVEKAAAPRSLAAAYAGHQANNIEAALDGGFESEAPGEVTGEGGGFKACYPDAEDSPCYAYDDFKLTPEGKVASFTIDGKPLAGRLVTGDGTAKPSPLGSVTLLSAYTTQSGLLAVATKIRTRAEAVVIHDAAARYRAPDGRQRGQNALTGPSEIAKNSTAFVVFYFQGPIKFGGAMTVELNNKDYSDTVSVELKIK